MHFDDRHIYLTGLAQMLHTPTTGTAITAPGHDPRDPFEGPLATPDTLAGLGVKYRTEAAS